MKRRSVQSVKPDSSATLTSTTATLTTPPAGPLDPETLFASAALEAMQSWSRVISQLKTGQTLLDVQAGVGVNVMLAAQEVGRSGRVFASDTDASRLQRLCQAAANSGYTQLVCLPGASPTLMLADDSVDFIINSVALPLEQPREFFLEVSRILQEGGKLAVDCSIDFHIPPERIKVRSRHNKALSAAVEARRYLLAQLDAAGFIHARVETTEPEMPLVRSIDPASEHHRIHARIDALKPIAFVCE